MRRSRTPKALLIGAVVLAVLAAVVVITRPLSSRVANQTGVLELKIADQNGRMRVDWDPSNPVIQSAQGGTLEVNDGGKFNRYPVQASVLRSGGLDYVRRNEDVLLTLTLYHDGKPNFQRVIRRIPAITLQAASPKVEAEPAVTRTRRR